jgi:hypothetical protein
MIDITFNMINGDCELITEEGNMLGACIRRLDTELDTTLYLDYGSLLEGLLGMKMNDVTLQFLNQTVNECLTQDERITDCSVTSEYVGDKMVAHNTIIYEDNELSFDYEVSVDGED